MVASREAPRKAVLTIIGSLYFHINFGISLKSFRERGKRKMKYFDGDRIESIYQTGIFDIFAVLNLFLIHKYHCFFSFSVNQNILGSSLLTHHLVKIFFGNWYLWYYFKLLTLSFLLCISAKRKITTVLAYINFVFKYL